MFFSFFWLPLLILLFILYSLCKEQRWNEFICKIKGIMNNIIKNEVDLNKDKKNDYKGNLYNTKDVYNLFDKKT